MRRSLEADFERTMAELIDGELDLEGLDENFRQLIAKSPSSHCP